VEDERLAGHAARMGGMVEKPEGERPLRKPMFKFMMETNVEMDFKEMVLRVYTALTWLRMRLVLL
jgi:hypothetical protein